MLDYHVKNQEEDNLPHKLVNTILLLMELVVELKVLMKIIPLLLILKLIPLGKMTIELLLPMLLLYQDTVLLLPLENKMLFFMVDIKSKLNVPLIAEDLDLVMFLKFKPLMLKYGIE